MKNLIQYSFSCSNSMFNFLKNRDLDKLVADLKIIENHAIESLCGEDAALWFRFGSDDTLATTVNDVINDLNLPTTHGNHQLILEKFKLVTKDLNAKNELRVFLS